MANFENKTLKILVVALSTIRHARFLTSLIVILSFVHQQEKALNTFLLDNSLQQCCDD